VELTVIRSIYIGKIACCTLTSKICILLFLYSIYHSRLCGAA